jgi:tetratricopeptide (TPR) repeat protein
MLFLFAISLIVFTPKQILAQINRGIDLYNEGEFFKALSVFQDILKANPADNRANYYFGLCALSEERYADAEEAFLKVKPGDIKKGSKQAKGILPSEYDLQIGLAQARLGLKLYEDAWSTLEYAKVLNAGSADVYVYRGVFYLQQDKNREAIKELEKAISLDAQNPYAYYYEGLAHYHAGEPLPAVEALKTFLQLAPFAPEAGRAKQIIDQLC